VTLLGTQRPKVFGGVYAPGLSTERFESVELGSVVTADVEDACVWGVYVSSKLSEVPTVGFAGSAHVQIVFEHEIRVYEIRELEMEAILTQIDGQGVGILGRVWRVEKLISQGLRTEIEGGL
jgi:hypothetical protein